MQPSQLKSTTQGKFILLLAYQLCCYCNQRGGIKPLESMFIAKQELITRTLSFVYKTSRLVRISLLISNLNKEFFFFLGKVIL